MKTVRTDSWRGSHFWSQVSVQGGSQELHLVRMPRGLSAVALGVENLAAHPGIAKVGEDGWRDLVRSDEKHHVRVQSLHVFGDDRVDREQERR